MTIYVVGFLFQTGEMSIDHDFTPEPWKVLLIRKHYKPDHKLSWQDGLLNAFGGKVDAGESPEEAMVRETKEEIGITINDWKLFCVTEKCCGSNQGDEVFFFKSFIDKFPKLPEKTDAHEELELINITTIPTRTDLIDNLQWLIPMAWAEKQEILAEVLYKS